MTYAIDDHMIESLNWAYELIESGIVEEMKSGKYTKITDCPAYAEYKAVQKAQLELERIYYGEESIKGIKESNRERLEFLKEDVLEKLEREEKCNEN